MAERSKFELVVGTDGSASGRAAVAAAARFPWTARAGGRGAIVEGSGGHGVLGRMLLGSVSRQVVQAAACPVLFVKGRLTRARRFTIGVDGSTNSRRAAEMVARLSNPSGAG